MSRRLERSGRRLGFGYRRDAVERYLAELDAHHDSSIAHLRSVLKQTAQALTATAKELRAERAQLKAKEGRQQAVAAALTEAQRLAADIVSRAERTAAMRLAQLPNLLAEDRRTLALLKTETLSAREELKRLLDSALTAVATSGPATEDLIDSRLAARILPEHEKTRALVALGADGLLRIGLLGPSLKATTQSGAVVGWITRYVIERDSGVLIGYEVGRTEMPGVVPAGSVIPATKVLAVTPESLLVPNDVGNSLVATSLVAGEPLPVSQAPSPAPLPRDERQLTAESRQRQMTYIVGKVAGRDLVTPDGAVIVGKGARITPEIVEAAREAALLPELIVHMTLPTLPATGEARETG
ncbi:MAG: hypothetical protein RDU89_00410 [bacterium]|nr:hypothetical protein [bacterium]